MTTGLTPAQYEGIVRRALEEDVGSGDITTEATVPAEKRARGIFLAKTDCIVAGLQVAFEAFRMLETEVQIEVSSREGESCRAGHQIAEVFGAARTLLTAERTALNFLQRLSGIATLTHRFVDAAAGGIIVLDTRKTTPTLRALEKYAVRIGGGTNHRFGLYDAILIKDNHVRLAEGIETAVARAREHRPGTSIEVEAQSIEQVHDALTAGADVVLVDNFSTGDIRKAVELCRGRARVEISGGVTLERIPELATTGADYVSAGALTHSAPSVDISFEIEPM